MASIVKDVTFSLSAVEVALSLNFLTKSQSDGICDRASTAGRLALARMTFKKALMLLTVTAMTL